MNIKHVIEPFGGSFAVTREVYMDEKYKRYVNDNDENLYNLYTSPETYLKTLKKFYDICSNNLILLNGKYYPDKNIVVDEFKKYNNNKFVDMVLDNRMIKGGIKHNKKFPDYKDSLEIIKKIKFTDHDWEKIINRWKTKDDAFIFLDPPYLFSNNTQYDQQYNNDSDCSDIVIKILDIMNDGKTKAKIMLIINNLKLIKILFKKYIKLEYDVVYQICKRRESHLVICNYDL